MKNKYLKYLLLSLLVLYSSCTLYKDLNLRENYHEYPKGALISFVAKKDVSLRNSNIKLEYFGELISADSNEIVLLLNGTSSNKVQKIDFESIIRFKGRYARNKDLSWTIPIFSLFTISHGWFLIFTFPINLITTSAIAVNSNKDFTFTNKQMPITELYKFARFPQGIPEGLDLKELEKK